jgi:PAS domain S-box-containing protein
VLESDTSRFSFQKYLNKNVAQFFGEEAIRNVDGFLNAALKSNESIEFTIDEALEDKTAYHFEGQLKLTTNNDIVLTVRNITVEKKLASINDKLLLDYQILFNKSTTSIFLVEVLPDNSFKYISTNHTHQKTSGIPLENIAGKTPQDVLGNEIGDIIANNYKRCLDARTSINYEETLELPTGKGTWLTTLDPVIEDNNIKYIVGSSIEITERKRFEQLIFDQSQLLNEIKANITDILLEIDPKGMIYFCSDSIQILGFKREEIIGKNVSILLHPNDEILLKDIIQDINLNNKVPSKLNLKSFSKNGELHHFESIGKIINNSDGTIKEILVVTRDITDNIIYQEELNKTRNLLQQTSEMAKIGAYEKNFKLETDDWSPVTRSIFEVPDHFTPNMENGLAFYKEGESRQMIEAAVTKAIQQGIPFEVEVIISTYNKNERWVKVMGVTEFEDGKCIRLFGTIQDIHEIKLNQIVLEAQNKALKEISWTQSHKVRAPISRLYTLLDLFKSEFKQELDNSNMEIFQYLIDSLDELDRIVIDITDKTYMNPENL